MSGGYFDYKQHGIEDIIDGIESIIDDSMKERPAKVKKSFFTVKELIKLKNGVSWLEDIRSPYKTVEETRESLLSDGYVMYERSDEISYFTEKYSKRDCMDILLTYGFYEEFEDGNYYNEYSEKTIMEFRIAVDILKIASIYSQRIDWLVSGDDSEDTFHERLKKDLTDWFKKNDINE